MVHDATGNIHVSEVAVCQCGANGQSAPGATLSLGELRLWAKERLAPYKVPAALAVVDALPRNAMGQVVKPDVSRLFG